MGIFAFPRKRKAATHVVLPPILVVEAPSTSVAALKKKASSTRLWMKMNRDGQSELMECDKSVIIKRASLPSRDLRILGPIFSPSSSILSREKAMIVNLEFVRAIVTAEELLLLDPLRQEVIPFIDKLRRQLPLKSSTVQPPQDTQLISPSDGQWFAVPETSEGLQEELPFEFQVLEIALEVVCSYLDSTVAELEKDAYPALDDLARNVSTKNLENVRSLKSHLTRLLARVQKVKDEIEHLLDSNEDMAQLYVTRRWIQNQQAEAIAAAPASSAMVPYVSQLHRTGSTRSGSLMSNTIHNHDVEELEMLLEAYFMQLDSTRNKILSVREYIADTEDYVNIQLDNKRNELIQLQLVLSITSFAVAIDTLLVGMFGMNIPCTLYHINGIFEESVGLMTVISLVCFILVLGYARWKKLLG